jgi:hypothetical protein
MQLLENPFGNICIYHNHHHQPEPDYEEGDELLPNDKNILMVWRTRKLAQKLDGPFGILAKIGKSSN